MAEGLSLDQFMALPPVGGDGADASAPEGLSLDAFMALPPVKPAEPVGFTGAVSNLGSRIKSRVGQMGSELLMETTRQRAADRQKTFSEILQDEKLSSGMKDMQGKPLETNTGGEYISASMRWLDAKYADLIGTDDAAAADAYAKSMQQNMDAFAKTPKSDVAEKFQKDAIVKDATFGQTLGNFGGAFLKNPLGGVAWALETAGESLPQMVAGAGATLLTKNPALGIAIMGGGSYATERYTSPGDFFQEKGLDLKKPEDRKRLLNDPKLMKEAAERGVIRGLVVGAFDALSAGVAGQKLLTNPLAEAVAQTLTQGILGASGEAVGRLGAGQKMDWGDIASEFFAEMVSLPLDMVTAGREMRADKTPPPPPAADTGAVVPPGGVPPGAVSADTILPPEEPAGGGGVIDNAPGTVTEQRLNLPPQRSDAEVLAEIERRKPPVSPRLTPADVKSPIPNEVIDAGKSLVEDATGKPSSVTTTEVVDGERRVVDTPVATIVAKDRAETAALIGQITAGVAQPIIAPLGQQAAPPAGAVDVAATPTPEAATASVGPPVAAAPEARFAAQQEPLQGAREGETRDATLTRRFGAPGTQARTLEEARLVKGDQPIVINREEQGKPNIEIRHPYYESFEAWVGGKKVGNLNISPQGPHASSVTVEPGAQRTGVATALYDAAEAALGRKMTPSPMGLSGDAIAFWKNRFAGVSPEEKQAILQEALDKGIEQKIGKSARERVDALGYAPNAPRGATEKGAETSAGTAAPTKAVAPVTASAEAPRTSGETDKEFAKRVVDKRPSPETLPEKHDDYFVMDKATVIPLDRLISTKTEEENKQGGDNGAKRMAAAAQGELSKREPITVEPAGGGKYRITDGNGTFTTAQKYGWKAIPVTVKGEPAAQTALRERVIAKREAAAAPAEEARQPGETDKVFAKRVVDKRPAPKSLPEKYGDYFLMDKPTVAVVPIGDLVSSKTDEENAQGGGNAAKRMEAAAKGELEKRDPITVERRPDGKYLILDGNGTYTSVKALGWKNMPVIVAAPEARFAAKREEAAPTATAHPTSFTGETATPEQRAPFFRHPYTTIDAIYEDAQARQDELGEIGKAIADKVGGGVTFGNPGLKTRKKSTDKIEIKKYENAGQITDAIRGGFHVGKPGQASQIIRELARHFEVLDEGWAVTNEGYFDRKALIRFDDGRVGEIQFWEPHVFQAKEEGLPGVVGGVKGHDLYDARAKPGVKDTPRGDELRRQMQELYAHALSLADAAAWTQVLSEGRLSKPEPKYLNLKRQASSDISRQEWSTSTTSTSTQSPPGLSSALASESVKTTGRSSQLQNLTTDNTSFQPTVLRKSPAVKPEPEAQRALKEKIEAKRKAAEDAEPEAKFQARTLREGTETPASMGLPTHKPVPEGSKAKPKKITYNTREIAAALEARQRERYGTIARNDRSPEAMDRISDWIVDEVDFESHPDRTAQSGAGWYSTKFQNALDRFGSLFPELLSNRATRGSALQLRARGFTTAKQARNFLTALIAVTSDGQKAEQNFIQGARLYNEFRRTGTIDIDKVTFGADRNLSIKTNLANILHMLETYGPEEMHRMLMAEQTASELRQTAQRTGATFSTEYQGHIRMPLAALIFGPKLGAFYANLMGAHGYLTMDRWWSRTFNRYRGQILTKVTGLMDRPTDARGNKIGLARFKEMIGKPDISDEQALSEAAYHAKLYFEKGFKNGTDIEKTANTIKKDAFGTEDMPFGAVDRTFMIETTEMARQKLAARGVDISLADIQAILWYFEKRLYSELGARQTADVSYEEIANRVAQGAAAGTGPAGPAASATVEGPDGARFSVGPQARDQDTVGEGSRSQGLITATPEEFIKARNASSRPGYLSPLEPGDIAGHQLFLSPDKTVGVAVDPNGDVQNVFNNGGPKGSGAKAMVAAIENGGRTLDAYDGFLPKFYRQFGFVETGRMSFNPEFANEGWDLRETPDVVFMAWRGYPDGTAERAINRASSRANWIENEETSNRVTDFDAAKQESRSAAQSAGAGTTQLHGQDQGSGVGGATREPDLGSGEASGRNRLKVSRDQSGVSRETIRGGHVEYTLRPEFKAKAAAILKDLQPLLDKLAPGTPLRIFESIRALVNGVNLSVDAQYLRGMVDLAMNADGDLASVLHHEAVHALWNVFTDKEKAILTRMAEKKGWVTDQIKATYPEQHWVEEGIAHAIAEWHQGTRMDGVVAKAFKRFMALVRALGSVFTKHSIRTAEDVFADVASGKIGQRLTEQKTFREPARDGGGRFVESLFQAAWHGTPHLFDKFSTAFMGSGEGAQAYGWGLYFAGKKEIAEYYRDKLAPKTVLNYEGKARGDREVADMIEDTIRSRAPFDRTALSMPHAKNRNGMVGTREQYDGMTSALRRLALAALMDAPKDGSNLANWFDANVIDYEERVGVDTDEEQTWNSLTDAFRAELQKVEVKSGGKLYKVNLPEDSDLMNWDVPLSKQPPAVREKLLSLFDNKDQLWIANSGEETNLSALPAEERRITERTARKLGGQFGTRREITEQENLSGYALYRELSQSLAKDDYLGQDRLDDGNDRAASEALRDAGIPGHRFLDATSRADGTGTYNYVIYDDAAIDIEARFAAAASTRTPAFKRWFGDSKVVDAKGEPLAVYGGSNAVISAFSKAKSPGGFYFSPDRGEATGYGKNVLPVYVSLQNPLVTTDRRTVQHSTAFRVETMREDGYDGMIWVNKDGQIQEVVAFEPNQIKSVDNVNPTDDPRHRFALTAAPHTPRQVQQTMQGFIARGQPIDRAIRLPLQMLGGIDEQGRWRPGKRLSDKLGPQRREGGAIGAVTGSLVGGIFGGPVGAAIGGAAGATVGAYVLGSAPAPVNGRFPWLSGIAENAKRGLISNYGLDPEYIEAYRKSDLGKTAILRQAAGIMKVLHNAGVSTVEARVLQSILSGTSVNDADMIRLAQPIRQAIDDLGAEAVSLGLISAESFERNRGAYLHRVYQKHEAFDDGSLAGWVSKAMSKRRKRIIGDSLKGRGLFWEVPVERLMQDAPNRGVPGKGDKWRVLDRTSADGKVSRRVYVPADKPTPVEFTFPGWVDRGEWEVRQVQGVAPTASAKKQGPQAATGVTLWRDYTEAERSKMGEIVDARYTIAKTFMLMANDLSTGRFYREVSQKAEWTSDTEPASPWKEGGEYNARNGRYWTDPEIQWVKVPDTAIAKTGGKKKWGALSGKWIRAEIWRDLNEVEIAGNPGTWRKLYAQWKKNKTARNPVVHMNNIMSNVMFMDMADIRTQDLIGGINAYFRGTKDFEEATENGAFGSDIVSQELRDNVLKPILDEIAKQSTGGTTMIPFLAKAGVVGVVADKLWTWAKTVDNGMLKAYQMEDEIFRMAAYMRRRSQGATPAEAGREARDQFLNYDIRAPWVLALRNSVLPFISYTYRAVPKLAENIMHRPWKVAKYATIAYAVNALSYLLDEGDDDEDKKKGKLLNREEMERAGLRDEEQGYTWLGSPRMVRMPWRDANGMPVFLDVRRWIPAGDIFDSAPGSAALPIPAPLQFGGPLQLAFELNLNKQAFTGDNITNELTDTPFERVSDVADWAWKSWAPASFWTPRSWYWTKIANALYGAKDQSGNVYSLPQAVLSSFGIKVKGVDVENGVMWHYKDFKDVQLALKTELRAAARQLDRGMISQSTFDSQAASIMRKLENLGVRADDLSKRTTPQREPVE